MSAHTALRPAQQEMLAFALARKRSALWCPMGGGKTAVALHWIAELRRRGEVDRALVVAPRRVALWTWPAEAAAWSALGLSVTPVLGSPAARDRARQSPAPVHSVSFDLLPWLVEAWGDAWPYRAVVIDEATRLKNFRLRRGGKRAAAFAGVAHKRVEHLLELTGTPAPNGLLDLWGQAWFLDKGERLGRTFGAFADRWFRPRLFGYGLQPLASASREIPAALSDIALSVAPPFNPGEPIVSDVPVVLPPKARRAYTELERQLYVELDSGSAVASNAAVLADRCRQLANGALYLDGGREYEELHEEKLDALSSIITEAAGGNVLVAYNFRSDLGMLRRAFPHGVEIGDRPNTVTEWNAGRIPLMFLHPQSAGHGLNLQHGGNIIVWYGLPWSLEQYLQAIERVGPMRQAQAGLNRPCYVYRILARDTVDHAVALRLGTKQSVHEALLAYRAKSYVSSGSGCS